MPVDNHAAFIYDRGGKRPLFEIRKLDYVSYGRYRDEMSDATVRLTNKEALAQAGNLAKIEPGRHELVIFRAGVREWEGPVNIGLDEGDTFEITADDCLHYYARTAMKAAYSSAYPKTEKVVARIERIIRAELARKEVLGYNLLPHLKTYIDADDSLTSTTTDAYQSTVYAHLDTLAAKSGIDYTMVGRGLHIWDTSKAKMGQSPVLTQADFETRVAVAKHGRELATRSIATDGRGGYGLAGGEDPYYGEVDLVSLAYDEKEDDELPTQAELNAQAKRNLAGRKPTPLTVRVPANSSINLRGQLQPKFWVPGIYVPLRGRYGAIEVQQMQKLQSVRVTEDKNGERVQVTLYPASDQDGV